MPDEEAENVCPSCGARVPEGEEVCDLCGTPVHSEATPPSEKQEDLPPADAGETGEGPYCHQCGWQNPAGARYCSQCGERLQDVSGAAPPAANVKQASLSESPPAATGSPAAGDATSERKDMRRQVSILVGASILLIVALFLLLVYNGQEAGESQAVQPDTSRPPAAMQGPGGASAELPAASVLREEEPLPESLVGQVDEIKAQIAGAQGEEKRAAQRRLINLYIGAGRSGLAALEQEQVARQEGTVEAWTTTGNLFYGWMQNMEGPRRAAAAEHAIEAYQRVLKEEPNNLDVRTDLATAYLETNNPMRGVQEIKRVLDQNPDHLQGRFNYGIMLTMIGRVEKAIQQFERVQEIAGPESPHTRRAQKIIQQLQKQGGQSGGAPAGS